MADQGPCWYLVSSESDSGVEYLVGLCENPVYTPEGVLDDFNGICGSPGDHIMGCNDFSYRCAGNLRKPENGGKYFRCKHIRAAREHALKILLPYMKQHEQKDEV